MIQLAIETSGRIGSLALMNDQSLIQSFPLPSGQRTAATLAGRLQEAIQWCDAEGVELDYVSVARGPGSFTGLRIGLTTAKAFCYATGRRLVAIDSVAAVAASVFLEYPAMETILVAVNAYRSQVFCGTYNRKLLMPDVAPDPSADEGRDSPVQSAWQTQLDRAQVLDADQFQQLLASTPSDTHFAGDESVFPIGRNADAVGQRDVQARFAERNKTDAQGVGALGHYAAGWNQWVDPMQLVPRYLKASAAEEKATERGG